MKIISAFLVAGTITAAAACSDEALVDPGPVAPDSVVSMPAFSFAPFTLVVKTGHAVIFDFPAESHNVIFVKTAGAPADIQETRNRKVSRTFATAGTFPYDCTIHPGMSGVIVAE